MRKKKKILFIIWSFSFGGGAERVLANIVNNLSTEKYEIDLLEYYHTDINKEKVNDNINVLNPIVDFRDNKFKKLISMILLKTFPNILRKIYINKKYDLEISFNYLIPTFLLSHKTKTISWVHGDIYDLKYNRINKILQKKSFKHVNKIVTISDNTYNSVKEIFPEYKNKLLIINNGLDLNKMIEKSSETKVQKSKNNTILYINRFDENKNPLFAIEVAKKLDELGYEYQMNFIGKGELETKMKEKIAQYKLDDKVKILGYQKNPYPYIKNSDIVIGCSKSEGFPTIFIEAITFGKPFVTTSVGGAKEISDNEKCGLIALSFEEYVEKLRCLLDNKKKYEQFSKHALEHSKNFSIEKAINKIENLIDNVIDGDTNE